VNELRLEGIAVYNPRSLSRDELCGNFCVREELLERLREDLRRGCTTGSFQHRLVLGQRGMGKTTLLHRLRFAIEDDEELAAAWLPLVFPEEQYDIGDLAGFWLNCLDAVADAMETSGEGTERLDELIERLETVPKAHRAAEALAALRGEGERRGRRLVLLVDNIDLVFDRIDKEQWALRKALSEDGIVLIGASAHASEATYVYDKAFYDFFAVEELAGLDLEETRALMCRLADRTDVEEVRDLAENHPERIEPIRILSGGNPRTIVLLFTVHAQGIRGDVRTDLDRLLDLCTPLYKHRFEELSAQNQRIVHALCVNWHPIGSAALARTLDLKSQTVSGQLERLCKLGGVQKVPLATAEGLTKKTGYQVAERFFNIWYLMRNSRRLRRKLLWFVEFLRLMNTPEERRSHAMTHLSGRMGGARDIETGLALAQAVEDPQLAAALEHIELQSIHRDDALRRELVALLDLEGEDIELKPRSERIRILEEAKRVVYSQEWPGFSQEEVWSLIGGHPSLDAESRLRWARRGEGGLPALEEARVARAQDVVDYSEELMKLRAQARADGWLETDDDVSGAQSWAYAHAGDGRLHAFCSWARTRHSADAVIPDVNAAAFEFDRAMVTEDLATVRKAVTAWADLPGRADWFDIAAALYRAGRFHESLPAWELSRDPAALGNRGATLLRLGRIDEAEEALRAAVRTNPKPGTDWFNLGVLLVEYRNRPEEAAKAFREAVKHDPSDSFALNNLGVILQDDLGDGAGAYTAYLQSAESDPTNAFACSNLARLLHLAHRHAEAVQWADRARQLGPDWPIRSFTRGCAQLPVLGFAAAARAVYRALSDPSFLESDWGRVMHFFHVSAQLGHATEAAAFTAELPGDGWVQVRIALLAASKRDENILLSVAPEVREAARPLYELFITPWEPVSLDPPAEE